MNNATDKIIVLCDSYAMAEFEYFAYCDYLKTTDEVVIEYRDAICSLTIEGPVMIKFMGERWLPFLKDLDDENTLILDISEFVESTYELGEKVFSERTSA